MPSVAQLIKKNIYLALLAQVHSAKLDALKDLHVKENYIAKNIAQSMNCL